MDSIESLAKDRWEAAVGRELIEWDVAGRQQAVDFRCLDAAPLVGVEVKQVTHPSFHQAKNAMDRHGGFQPSLELKWHWHVCFMVPTSGNPVPVPRMRDVRDQLEAILLEFESRNWRGSQRGRHEFHPDRGFYGPKWEFDQRFPGAIALGHDADPDKGMPAGIWIVNGFGQAAPDDPNGMAAIVEAFLNGPSKEATNLRDKLGASTDDEHHGFLVLMPFIEEAHMFHHWTVDRLPTQPIELPSEIDRVWISARTALTWSFDATNGWRGFETGSGLAG